MPCTCWRQCWHFTSMGRPAPARPTASVGSGSWSTGLPSRRPCASDRVRRRGDRPHTAIATVGTPVPLAAAARAREIGGAGPSLLRTSRAVVAATWQCGAARAANCRYAVRAHRVLSEPIVWPQVEPPTSWFPSKRPRRPGPVLSTWPSGLAAVPARMGAQASMRLDWCSALSAQTFHITTGRTACGAQLPVVVSRLRLLHGNAQCNPKRSLLHSLT